jgi:hypothetical protein
MKLSIQPTPAEVAQALPGDDIVSGQAIVIDRAFTLAASPENAWPWFSQLGKNRAGWYFPRSVEHFIPKKRQGLRAIDSSLLNLKQGERIDDWGGKHGYLEAVSITPPKTLVYKSTRGRLNMSWVITLWPVDDTTRVLIRLRLSSTGKKFFLESFGKFFDKLTIIGLAAGLAERLADK